MIDTSILTRKVNLYGFAAIALLNITVILTSFKNESFWKVNEDASTVIPIAFLLLCFTDVFLLFFLRRIFVRNFARTLKRRRQVDSFAKAAAAVYIPIFVFAASPVAMALVVRLLGYGEEWFWPLVALSPVTFLIHLVRESEIKSLLKTYEEFKE